MERVRSNRGLGITAVWFKCVNEYGVGVGGPVRASEIEFMTDGATVIRPMIYDMKQNFLSCHCSPQPIDKREFYCLTKLVWSQPDRIGCQPCIGGRESFIEIREFWY